MMKLLEKKILLEMGVLVIRGLSIQSMEQPILLISIVITQYHLLAIKV